MPPTTALLCQIRFWGVKRFFVGHFSDVGFGSRRHVFRKQRNFPSRECLVFFSVANPDQYSVGDFCLLFVADHNEQRNEIHPSTPNDIATVLPVRRLAFRTADHR